MQRMSNVTNSLQLNMMSRACASITNSVRLKGILVLENQYICIYLFIETKIPFIPITKISMSYLLNDKEIC